MSLRTRLRSSLHALVALGADTDCTLPASAREHRPDTTRHFFGFFGDSGTPTP